MSEESKAPRDPTQMVDEQMLEDVERLASEPPPAMRPTAPPPLPSVRAARRTVLWGSIVAGLVAVVLAIVLGGVLGPEAPRPVEAPAAEEGGGSGPSARPEPSAAEPPAVVELGAVVLTAGEAGTTARDAGVEEPGGEGASP